MDVSVPGRNGDDIGPSPTADVLTDAILNRDTVLDIPRRVVGRNQIDAEDTIFDRHEDRTIENDIGTVRDNAKRSEGDRATKRPAFGIDVGPGQHALSLPRFAV